MGRQCWWWWGWVLLLLCAAWLNSVWQTPNGKKSRLANIKAQAIQPGKVIYTSSRNSSVGRALDWRSKGPWFNPGFRQSIFFHFFNHNAQFMPLCVLLVLLQSINKIFVSLPSNGTESLILIWFDWFILSFLLFSIFVKVLVQYFFIDDTKNK